MWENTSLKTFYIQDKTENRKYTLQTIDIIMKKYIFTLPGQKFWHGRWTAQATLWKNCAGHFLPTFKILTTRPFLGKKRSKQKVAFLSDSISFTVISWKYDTEEIVGKKIK